MPFIGIGIRHNLLYPSIYICFIFLLRAIRIILENVVEYKAKFILALLMLLPNSIFSSIFICFLNRQKEPEINNKSLMGNSLIQNEKRSLHLLDNQWKILLLVIICSYFNFIDSISREFLGLIDSQFKIRIRIIEILIASIFCRFTIKTRIYKHHIVSLIIISIFLIINMLLESYIYIKIDQFKIEDFLIFLGISFVNGICRVFTDTIEKYLFEYNYLDPFKLLRLEGIFEIVFIFIMSFFKGLNEFKELSKLDDKIIYAIILLFLHFVFSGFKNIYKIHTIQLYSPMTRALADAFIDPFIIIYDMIFDTSSLKNLLDYCVNIICSIITIFFSLVYNEFLIIYSCGLELEVHKEISKRSTNMGHIELIGDYYNDNNDDPNS